MTQFYSALGTVKAKAIAHDWPTQALRAGATNEAAEGFTPSFAASDITVRVRRTNQCQIIRQAFAVSGTQEEVDKAGLGQSSEYDEQKMNKFKEIGKDADFELLRSVLVTRDADAATAGEMRGALDWVPAGNAKNANGAAIESDLFNECARSIVEAAGQSADHIFCAGKARTEISKWTTNYKEHQTTNATVTDTFEKYKGDWGTFTVVWDLQMDPTQILVVRLEHLKKAFLRPPQHVEQSKGTIDGRRGYVLMELTLEARNPNTMGRIYGLAA